MFFMANYISVQLFWLLGLFLNKMVTAVEVLSTPPQSLPW